MEAIMENIDYTKLSSKGQIIVPKGIRDSLNMKTGEIFVIFADRDTIILKRVQRPSDTDLKEMFARSQRLARQRGLNRADSL
jgi:AbrB family looped-hinge helix DNA binding protein